MSGNTAKPRGISATELIGEAGFHAGAADWKAGRPFAADADLPALKWMPDLMCNRQRVYELGRLVAAFARLKRRSITAATVRAAKREGFLP